MKKNILKATLVAAFVLIAGFNVYNVQKSDVALASGSEGEGLPWKGYYSNWDKGCCSPGKWNDECSGSFSPC